MKIQPKRKIQPLSLGSTQASDKVTPVMDFLRENYQIETNRYNPSIMRVRSLKKIYNFPVSVDDISLHMLQEGVPHTRQMIQMILRSPNQIKRYDPVKEYFEGLRGHLPEESHIDRLLSHIRVREFGDRPAGYYQQRAVRYIRRWLAAAAACALGKYANEAALVFVNEDEGDGKSTLARSLCPGPLQDMFVTSSSDHRSFNADQAMVTNFLVLFDEMRGITPARAEDFKMLLSAQKLPVRMKGDLCPIPRPRIASVLITTNNRMGSRHGFLYPALGTRRFVCIHVERIDWSYAEKVDVDALWAEALALSEDPDFDFRLGREDYAELGEVNQRYIIESPASVLLQRVYTLPDGTEQDEMWRTPTEVVAELHRLRLVKSDVARFITPRNVGEALRSLGFERKMIYGAGERLYKYHLKPLL